MLLRLELSLITSPDFVKLVVISRVWGFSTVVTGVQTVQQSVRFQQIPEKENAIIHIPQRYSQTNTHTNTHPALMVVLRSVGMETLVLTVIMLRFIR